MEDLFPGPAQSVPRQSDGWVIRFGPEGMSDGPAVVRHASGYSVFVDLVTPDVAGALARDVPGLLRRIHELRAALDDLAHATAAAVFLGNALNASHPASVWQATEGRAVGSGPYVFDVDAIVAAVRDDPVRIDEFAAVLAGWDAADERQRVRHAAMAAVHARLEEQELAPLPALVLPRDDTVLLDDAGAPFAYGDRWPDGPPEEAYSRVTHPERFAVLHATSEMLVRFLEEHFDVAVMRSTTAEGEPVVELRPAAGAPVRLVLTAFPGVTARAGLLWQGAFPTCGCDACDESGEDQAAALTNAMLGVVGGGLLEERLGDSADPVWYVGLREPDGGTSSGARGLPADDDRLVDADSVVALAGEPWPAWPRRA